MGRQLRNAIAMMATLAFLVAACAEETPTAGTTSAPPAALEPTTTTTVADEPPTTTTTAAAPEPLGPGYGGEVIIADDQWPPTFNPYAEGGDYFIVNRVGQALFTGVYDIDAETLELIPEVVTELPAVANGGLTVNADGTMTVRYEIRDEAVWADGVPISGDDFAFTYEMIRNGGFARWQEEAYDLILPDTVVVGPKSFEYTLRNPTVGHEFLFGVLIPEHDVAGGDFLADWTERPWVSGGPFVFAEADLVGPERRIRMQRNDNYWKSDPATGLQLPYLDAVEFVFIPETEKLIGALLSRSVDVILPPPSLRDIERLLRSADEGVATEVLRGPVWEFINFQFGENNRNQDSLNRYADYRRAVAHAIDRNALTDAAVDGFGEPLGSYLDVYSPPLSTGAWDRYGYDPERARRLLAGVCADVGRDCVSDRPQAVYSTTSNGDVRIRIAEILSPMFADVGIDLTLDLEDSMLFFGPTLETGTWDIGEWAYVGIQGNTGLLAAVELFDPGSPPPEGSNYLRWGTPAVDGVPVEQEETAFATYTSDFNQSASTVVDEHTARFAEIADEMRTTVDRDVLVALSLEAESILADQAVIIPLYARLTVAAYWSDEIAGYRHNPTLASDTWNIETWYRVDR